MNTSDTANKTSLKPLERMKTPVPVLDTPENSIEEKRIGWFDQNEFRGFDATVGSIDFNPDKVVPSPVVSEMFGGNNEWISFTPSNVAEKIVNTASTAVNVAGNLASAGIDAGSDLFKQITGTPEQTEVPQNFQKAFEKDDVSKLDPTVVKEQEEAQEYSVIKQAEEVIAKAQADYRGEKMFEEAVKPKISEITDLANLQGSYKDVLDDKGEIRTDLQASVAQRREAILKAQQTKQEPLVSTSKQGGQGLNSKQLLNDNLSNETKSTAQQAVG